MELDKRKGTYNLWDDGNVRAQSIQVDGLCVDAVVNDSALDVDTAQKRECQS